MVNFTNILKASFQPISVYQKVQTFCIFKSGEPNSIPLASKKKFHGWGQTLIFFTCFYERKMVNKDNFGPNLKLSRATFGPWAVCCECLMYIKATCIVFVLKRCWWNWLLEKFLSQMSKRQFRKLNFFDWILLFILRI